MVTGNEFATQACSQKYDNIPYSKMDCQAFVEEVLADCGVRNSNGKRYNWKGSNDMWRNALKWRGTIKDALDKFGHIPDGAWLFIIKNDIYNYDDINIELWKERPEGMKYNIER